MATFEQGLHAPRPFNREQNPQDFLQRRFSTIAENETVSRRGSESQYIGKRTRTLKRLNFRNRTEQDASILSSMHEEHRNDQHRQEHGHQKHALELHTIDHDKPVKEKHKMTHSSGSDEPHIQKQASSSTASARGTSTPTTPMKYDEDLYEYLQQNAFENYVFKPNVCRHFTVFLLLTVVCALAFYVYWDWYKWEEYYTMSYIIIFWAMSNLFLFLNFTDKFHAFHEWFGCLCNGRAASIFVLCTIFFALTEYILWSLYEESIGVSKHDIEDRDTFRTILIFIDVVYYLTIVFLFCSFMAYWPTIAYYFSESRWLQAMFYMSCLGYCLIWICRKLRPPNPKRDIIAWYRVRDTHQIVYEICWITSVLFLIFVVLFGLTVPVFGESVTYISDAGTWYAIGVFVFLAFVIMLTPLMPGSIIDMAGGFLFIYVLTTNENFNFFLAWLVAVGSIILLHYCGACAQWAIGSRRFVQFYLNTTLPPELLAASDSVLEEANCVTVGIIGYVFMDTGNGLNQGRINMRFWTQLCSEWSCIPNAFALVSLGATIALPLIYEDWNSDDGNDDGNDSSLEKTIVKLVDVMIPLFALIAGLVQFTGTTIAVRTLGASVDSDEYMMSREKWFAVQFFYKVSGYIPSREGWKNDVLQLGNKNDSYPEQYQKCLFEDIMPLQRWYVEAQQTTMNKQTTIHLSMSKLKLLIIEKYRTELNLIRNTHYTSIEAQYDDLINNKKWLIKPSGNGESDVLNNEDEMDHDYMYFSQENIEKHPCRWRLQLVLMCILILTFWITFYRIYWQSEFFDRVRYGLATFNSTVIYDWVAVGIFIGAWCVYNHLQIYLYFVSLGRQFCFVLRCCRIHLDLESRFKTPGFDCQKYQYESITERGTISSVISQPNGSTGSNQPDFTNVRVANLSTIKSQETHEPEKIDFDI